ncbi:MAG TPA: glycosyltransferase family 2 protein [Dehalococcoidia bacterium]|nr:glycosyltransferase family 2 protein [Dehalococcoidia bacterium]
MLVSVVTPSLNRGVFIEETIRSVMAQSYLQIEHIVIDGGSTDGTLDILQRYKHLTWVSEPDNGAVDAVNKGWRMARGEVVAMLPADDTYTPWAVQCAVDYLTEYPCVDMVYGDCNVIDAAGRVFRQLNPGEFDLGKLLRSCMIPGPTAFIRKSVLDKVGLLDTNLKLANDYDLWLRIGLNFQLKYIPRVLANFRMCPGSSTPETPQKFERLLYEHLYIYEKFFANQQLPKKIKDSKHRVFGSAYMSLGLHYHSLRKGAQARHYLVRALVADPKLFIKFPWLSIFFTSSLLRAYFITEALVKCKRRILG